MPTEWTNRSVDAGRAGAMQTVGFEFGGLQCAICMMSPIQTLSAYRAYDDVKLDGERIAPMSLRDGFGIAGIAAALQRRGFGDRPLPMVFGRHCRLSGQGFLHRSPDHAGITADARCPCPAEVALSRH